MPLRRPLKLLRRDARSTRRVQSTRAHSEPSTATRGAVGNPQTWQWNGHAINYTRTGSGPAVVLLHGFGANLGHYRQSVPALAKEGYTVYAVDMLGFGASSKPVGFDYSLDGWSQMVISFLQDVVKAPAVLTGNSIGSLVSLLVAADAPAAGVSVPGLVLLNCAGGMNSKFILKLPDWRWKLFTPLFAFFDLIFNSPSIMQGLFAKIASSDNIKNALSNVYVNKEMVDDELVEIFLRPSRDEGALETFCNILTGDPGPRPDEVMPKVKCPVCVIWGDEDTVTALDGPVGKYFRELNTADPSAVQFHLVNSGHCPQDDVPEVVNDTMLKFLGDRVMWP